MRFQFRRLVCFGTALIFCGILLYLIITNPHFNDEFGRQARIRDAEELRIAQARTLLFEIKQLTPKFDYNDLYSHLHNTSTSQTNGKPSLTFAILAPNRATREIDDYQPYYLTELVARLINAVMTDIKLRGRQFSNVNITICPTNDNLDKFYDLKSVSSILAPNAIKPRSFELDSHDLPCRTVIDAGSCLLQSAPANFENQYIILLEDDVMNQPDLLKKIGELIDQLTVQLPSEQRRYIGAIQLLDGHNQFNQLLSTTLFVFLLFALCANLLFRLTCRYSNKAKRHSLYLSLTLLVSVVFLLLAQPPSFSFPTHSLHASIYPNFASTGAAVLFKAETAYQIGLHLTRHACRQNQNQRLQPLDKASVIYHFLASHNQQIWSTSPALFKHFGLYSIYHGRADSRLIDSNADSHIAPD